MVIYHQTRDLECFADSCSNPWNLPTIRYPDLTAIAPPMSLLSLYALLFLQSHLFLICVALTYNDSRIILHRICQILRNCQCKGLGSRSHQSSLAIIIIGYQEDAVFVPVPLVPGCAVADVDRREVVQVSANFLLSIHELSEILDTFRHSAI